MPSFSSPPTIPHEKKRKRGTSPFHNGKQTAGDSTSLPGEDAKRERKKLRRLEKKARAEAEKAENARRELHQPESSIGGHQEQRDNQPEPVSLNEDNSTNHKGKKEQTKKKKQDRQDIEQPSTEDVSMVSAHLERPRSRTSEPSATIEPAPTTQRPQPMDIERKKASAGETSHTNDPTEPYGPGVLVQSPTSKLYAAIYYPQRTEPLKVPSGELSVRARAVRYETMSSQDVATRIADHEKAAKKCPLAFQEVFKGTARGLFDREVHTWLVPILWNYHNRTQRQDRIRYLQTAVRDLFHVFKDLHPDFLQLKDVEMELDYQSKVRNRISSAYYQIARTMKVPGKLEFIDKEVVKYLTEGGQRPRPHDLWAKAEMAKGPEEGEIQEGNANEEAPSRYVQEWKQEVNRCEQSMSKKKWQDHRLRIEQEFRKNKFDQLNVSEKEFWTAQANLDDKPVDEMAALARGLPFITMVLDRFSKLSGVPLFVMLGAPDYSDPGKLLVYHDIYNHGAPADIPDFWSGPDQFGEQRLLPKWRGYVEEFYKRKPGTSAFQSLPMPTFVENEPQDPGVPPPELPPATIIEIPWSAEPENWAVESRERTAFENHLRRGLTDSFKNTFNKGRIDFGAIATRPLDFVEHERIPVCTIFCVLNSDGNMVVKDIPEGQHADLALPGNPRQMPSPHLHAYYHNIFDPDVPDGKRFRWKPSNAAGNHAPPTILLGGSKDAGSADNLKAKEQRATKGVKSDPKVKAKVSTVTKDPKSGPSSSTAKSGPKSSKPSKPSKKPSAEEDPMDTESDTPSPSDPDSDDDSDDDSDSNPPSKNTNPTNRNEATVLRSGRMSTVPDVHAPLKTPVRRPSGGKGKDVNPAERGGPIRSGHTKETANPISSSALSVNRRPSIHTAEGAEPIGSTRSLYRYRPSNAKLGKVLGSNHCLHISCLNRKEKCSEIVGLEEFPALYELVQRCTDLDFIFPAASKSPLLPWQLDHLPPNILAFFHDLNAISRPIPTYLNFSQACANDDGSVADTLGYIVKYMEDSIEYLEGLNLSESGSKGLPKFSSWTSILLTSGRCFAFLARIPIDDHPKVVERFRITHRRIVELAIIHLVFRYCASTVAGIISVLPRPTSTSTIANAPSVLGTAWLAYLGTLSRPINKLDISAVIGGNWAAQVNPTSQQDTGLPFFSLDSLSNRWLTITRTSKLEAEIVKLRRSLGQNEQDLGYLSIFQQFTLLGSIFAIHTGPTRKTKDDIWVQVIDVIADHIKQLTGPPQYEILHVNRPPPPTLIAPNTSTTPPQPATDTEAFLSLRPTTAVQAPDSSQPAQPSLNSPSSQSVPPPPVSAPPLSSPSSSTHDARSSKERRPSWAKAVPPGASTARQHVAGDRAGQSSHDPNKPPHHARPRRKSQTRSHWIAGDVLEIVHEGQTRQAKIRQKGPNETNLVLTSPQSRTILLQSDGLEVPLPTFNTDFLVSPGPTDHRMHPDSFVHEQPLPPYVSIEQIATGEYDQYFEDLWKKYPEDPTPEEYDDDYIEEYEDFEPAERLRLLLFDQSRREQFRTMFDLPISEYDERLAEIIGEVRRLLAHEPNSTYRRSSPSSGSDSSSSSSSSSSASSSSSSDSEDSTRKRSDAEGYPEEPARGRPSQLRDRPHARTPRPSSSSQESSDSPSSSESSGSSRLVKMRDPQFSGTGAKAAAAVAESSDRSNEPPRPPSSSLPAALSPPSEPQGPTNSGDEAQDTPNSEDNARNIASTASTVNAEVLPENQSNPNRDIEVPACPAIPAVSEVVRNIKDSAREMGPEVQDPTLAETIPGRGDTAAPMTEDNTAKQCEDQATQPTKKRRGPPKGPRALPGPPTRSSTRISASASNNHPQISNNNAPAAPDAVSHTATSTRTTRSRSKSTSGNVQTTPARVTSPTKSKRAASSSNKPTTASASKKAKQPHGKNL